MYTSKQNYVNKYLLASKQNWILYKEKKIFIFWYKKVFFIIVLMNN